MSDERMLLEAGAVVALVGGGAGGAAAAEPVGGDHGDVLTARAYRHSALEGRTVVRLVTDSLGPAEDLALEYLGFTGSGTPEQVGRVRRQSLGFPAWALVHDPANGHHALAVVKEMERLTRLVATKPGKARDGFEEIGQRLDRSVPHFLPTYYEQVARLFLQAESRTYASAFFGKARGAERRHALAVDEERLREVFLEFAAAGALSGKALRDHARGLAERLPAGAALAQFRALSLERCAAGLSPHAGMVEDLRRLAKAAGRDVAAVERELLAEVVQSGSVARAATSFWKAARAGLVAAAAEDETVRVRLLRLLPVAGGDDTTDFDAFWLALLEEVGAFDLLARRGPVDAPEQPPSVADWFSSWSQHRQRGWRGSGRLAAEQALVERFAERLAAEGRPVRLGRNRGRGTAIALDLLDVCLAAGVPVEQPEGGGVLELDAWLSDERPGRRDLAAVAADPHFGQRLRTAVETMAGPACGARQLTEVASDPVLGRVVAAWLEDRADDLERPSGLPELDRLLVRLARLSGPEVLATAPGAVARITAADPAPALGRTLRAGVLDELGWPALEEALDRIGPVAPPGGKRHSGAHDSWYQLDDAWPALIVRRGTHVAAVGPEGLLDERTLALPAPRTYHWDEPAVRYVGGQWLIASGHGDERRATWSGRSADAFRPAGTLTAPRSGAGTVSVSLPDGGRFFGARPVHTGDTSFGERRPVASDGISHWVLHEGRWYEYDVVEARRGRASVPAFLDSALAEGVDGGRLVEQACRLLPAPPGLEASPFGSKDGLLGWWVRYDPQAGTMTACSVDGGRSPAVPLREGADPSVVSHGLPVPPLRLPGGAVLFPRLSRHHTDEVTFFDAQGVEVGTVREGEPGAHYAAGTGLVPPLWHWHALRPRDDRGSAVLRSVTDEQAAALIASVEAGTEPVKAVRSALPGVTHPRLVEGVAGLVAEAVRCGRRIAAFARKAGGPVTAPSEPAVRYAHDGVLHAALRDLTTYGGYYGAGSDDMGTTAVEQVRALLSAVSATGPAAAPAGARPDGKVKLSGTVIGWPSLIGVGLGAVTLRALSPATDERERQALLEFLETALQGSGDSVLADPRGRLRTVRLCEPQEGSCARIGEIHRDGSRMVLITGTHWARHDERHWDAVEFDPAAAFGPWEGFALHETEVAGSPGDAPRAPLLRRLVARARVRGPLPHRPAQAREFADAVGVEPGTAALLLLGLPQLGGFGKNGFGPELLELLELKPAQAELARAALRGLPMARRHELLDALLPADADADADADGQLWGRGFDLTRVTAHWLAAFGKQRRLPGELVEACDRETRQGLALVRTLNPDLRTELTGRTVQRLENDRLTGEDPSALLSGAGLEQHVQMLLWAAYRLPYGDPLRPVLPVVLRALRERLADPALLLDVGTSWTSEGKTVSSGIREFYAMAPTGGADADGFVAAGPAIVLTPMPYGRDGESVWVRPAAVLPHASPEGGPDHPALALLAGLCGDSLPLRALRLVLSDGLRALAEADGPAGAQQDPAHSVPELVAAAEERLGLSADAAALYLMLLALPDPTDRHVAGWAGWKPARTKRARAELAATELVVEAKRARAGRSLFLPGGWTEHKAPRLPMEAWKATLYSSYGQADRYVVPDRPVPELFGRAWKRVVEGDAPAFEEFTGRRTGRGGKR